MLKELKLAKLIILKLEVLQFSYPLVVLAMFLLVIKLNPIDVYAAIIKGVLDQAYSIKQTLIRAIPLIITSLGISIAFKMQFWNIGGEGQIVMGAFAASLFCIEISTYG